MAFFSGSIALIAWLSVGDVFAEKNIVATGLFIIIALLISGAFLLCLKKAASPNSIFKDIGSGRFSGNETVNPEQERLGFTNEEWKKRNGIFLTTDELIGIQNGFLPTLYASDILLKPGELVRYACLATLFVTKTKSLGRTGGGGGVSFRVAKGVTVRTGGGASKTIYGDVTEKYDGKLFITNFRLVFLHNQKGFEQPMSKLTGLTPYSDGMELQFGSKTYSLAMPAVRFPEAVIRKILSTEE